MDTDKELGEVLAAMARLRINGEQQFTEARSRFLMLVRDDKAAAVAAERERWEPALRALLGAKWCTPEYAVACRVAAELLTEADRGVRRRARWTFD